MVGCCITEPRWRPIRGLLDWGVAEWRGDILVFLDSLGALLVDFPKDSFNPKLPKIFMNNSSVILPFISLLVLYQS
jgi:hypothetical protein